MARLTSLDGHNPSWGTALIPLTVTAHLQQGVVLDTGYGTALDGLLASAIRDRAKAAKNLPGSLHDGGLAATTPALVMLPLAVCLIPTLREPNSSRDLTPHSPEEPAPPAPPGTTHAGEWHWAATTARPHHPSGDGDPTALLEDLDPDVHHIHTRINERVLEATATRIPAALHPASGRFRNRRLPVITTPTTHLTWQAVGNPDAIEDLLRDLPSIGGHRHRGEGTVLAWEVTPDPDGSPIDSAHLHTDNTLGRPVPTACLTTLTERHPNLVTAHAAPVGIRPPYWHPSTRRTLHLPPPLTHQATARATTTGWEN